jgi:hypothetical protein
LTLEHLWQIGADQVTAIMQLRRVPFRTVAVELLLPFHHVGVASVFFDQPTDIVASLVLAARAFDAQHAELALNVAKYEMRSSHVG